jgi:hypothetical protein
MHARDDASSGFRIAPRGTTVEWGTALLAAAALLVLPWLVVGYGAGFALGRSPLVSGGVLLAVVALVAYVRLDRDPRSAVLIAMTAGLLNIVAAFAFILLLLVEGSCYDNGHIPAWAWPVAAAVYLAGAAKGLRSRWHAVWAVPVSALAAGVLLVLVAKIVTGSTGACID